MDIELLLLEMIKRMGLACIIALILTQANIFDRLMNHSMSKRDQIIFVLIFSALAIFGTYGGIPVDDALANSRMIGIMAAGLIGGPRLGLSVGLIAGIHRYFFGGFTAVACAVSSVLEGLLAGLLQKYYPQTPMPNYITFIAGAIGELVQMVVILVLAEPFDAALHLVDTIIIPMTIANSLGLMLFYHIIKQAKLHKEVIVASQSNAILTIARNTVSYLRKGLDASTAEAVVNIIKTHSSYAAVSITNRTSVLTYVGAEFNHHGPHNTKELTEMTRTALSTATIQIAKSKEEIGCPHEGCTLTSSIVVPLIVAHQVVGALKLYYTNYSRSITSVDIAFAQGLADLFSTQLELAEIDKQSKLAEEAKLQALYTQIKPHFLFNTLNTISALIRTNPELARRLLLKFSQLFRFVLHNSGKIISFAEALHHVKAYLEIEEARFGDKLNVVFDIPSSIEHLMLPALVLQPIVENAVKHGIHPLSDGGQLTIRAAETPHELHIDIIDNGVGFQQDPQQFLDQPKAKHIGITNVHQRLKSIYGPDYGLLIKKQPHGGTCVSLRIPKETI